MVSMDDDEVSMVADTDHASPDAEFDRQWAITVLARGLEALRQECQADGRSTLFEEAKPLLTGDALHGEQRDRAASCGMNLESFRVAVHRLKKRMRHLVKQEVAGTLVSPAMVQEEMQSLFAALGG